MYLYTVYLYRSTAVCTCTLCVPVQEYSCEYLYTVCTCTAVEPCVPVQDSAEWRRLANCHCSVHLSLLPLSPKAQRRSDSRHYPALSLKTLFRLDSRYCLHRQCCPAAASWELPASSSVMPETVSCNGHQQTAGTFTRESLAVSR